MAVTRIEEGGLGTDSFNLPVTLNGTDGSSTHAGDNIILDASASGVDAGERLLFEGIPPNIPGDISTNISVLSGVTLTVDSGATITNSGTASGFGATISNDANNRVITADGSEGLNGEANFTFDGSTLTVTGAADVSGVATATTFEPDGDTAAGDNAAIGYTSAEGLILTGQGSTDDITIKNDADTTIVNVATGATDVEISAGNILFGTGSKGIYLGVTSATAANLLDDYEEGTFTPTLLGSSSNPTISAGSFVGHYRKVGDVVFIYILGEFTLSNVGSGTIYIGALPFTNDDKMNVNANFSGRGFTESGTTTIVVPRLESDGVRLTFRLFNQNDYPGSETAATHSNISTDGDGANWHISLNYFTG